MSVWVGHVVNFRYREYKALVIISDVSVTLQAAGRLTVEMDIARTVLRSVTERTLAIRLAGHTFQGMYHSYLHTLTKKHSLDS